jgi:hypothetical protein
LNRLTAARAQVAHLEAQTQAWATHLRGLTPPLGQSPPQISACIALASQRMNDWPGATKYLVIAATLPPPTGQVAWYSLAGVHVRWIDMGCTTLPQCVAGEAAWGQAFAAAGVTDQRYFDAGESSALSSVFGAPVSHN